MTTSDIWPEYTPTPSIRGENLADVAANLQIPYGNRQSTAISLRYGLPRSPGVVKPYFPLPRRERQQRNRGCPTKSCFGKFCIHRMAAKRLHIDTNAQSGRDCNCCHAIRVGYVEMEIGPIAQDRLTGWFSNNIHEHTGHARGPCQQQSFEAMGCGVGNSILQPAKPVDTCRFVFRDTG